MAPMALTALRSAAGPDHTRAIHRSLAWLAAPPEVADPLIDTGSRLIWRKLARREPPKLSRTAQALASRTHPALRYPGLNLLFRPTTIDHESRPYHMGWMLHAQGGQ